MSVVPAAMLASMRGAGSTALIFLLVAAAAEASPYPQIQTLDNSDVIFGQLEQAISEYHVDAENAKPIPPLSFYTYDTAKGETLFDLASRVNLPYDTIATLNRLSGPMTFPKGTHLLLSSVPGIFVPLEPSSELEYLMASWRRDTHDPSQAVVVYNDGAWQHFLFFPGQRFHPVERAYFLGVLFRFPLPKGLITSPFGERIDPFTHTEMFHTGIDIAAPVGTDVYAARGGIVAAASDNREYGKYIILRHSDGFETVYAHLSEILVVLNERVASGMIIGKVGSTGMSTGPHLHFEIRRNGKPENPLPLLPEGDR